MLDLEPVLPTDEASTCVCHMLWNEVSVFSRELRCFMSYTRMKSLANLEIAWRHSEDSFCQADPELLRYVE